LPNPAHHTKLIKEKAKTLGFEHCGIAAAELLSEDARRLEAWLNKGLHGQMKYMENHFDMRINPTLLVPGAKSVITLLLNNFTAQQQKQDAPRISKYEFGRDYHLLIRSNLIHKMKQFLLQVLFQRHIQLLL
jgi:epoxyqueuosine reductase